jgi:ankyrin repeat protein
MTPAPSQLDAMLKAIHVPDVGAVKTLLLQGVGPNATDNYGVPLLHFAVRNNNVKITELLLDHGADPNQVSPAGFTPLMSAAEKSIAVLPLLIRRGARLDLRDPHGNTALDWAKKYGKPAIRAEATRLLLEAQENQKRLTAEKERIAALHDTAAKRQDALKKLRPKTTARPS